jgi:dihydrofolate reductase
LNWLDDRMGDGPNGQVFRELMATGAVIAGRRTFELAGRWQGDHHGGVPIHVLTHHVDPGDQPPGSARSISSRCCSAAAGGCSTEPVPIRSSRGWCGDWLAAM